MAPLKLGQEAAAGERLAVAAALYHRATNETVARAPVSMVTDCKSLLALNCWGSATHISVPWAGLCRQVAAAAT